MKVFTAAICYTDNTRGAIGKLDDVLLCRTKEEIFKEVHERYDPYNDLTGRHDPLEIKERKIFGETPSSPEGALIASVQFDNIAYGEGGDYLIEIREYEL